MREGRFCGKCESFRISAVAHEPGFSEPRDMNGEEIEAERDGWESDTRDAYGGHGEIDTWGDCRRYPPTKSHEDPAAVNDGAPGVWIWGWPMVDTHDWCGEWRGMK